MLDSDFYHCNINSPRTLKKYPVLSVLKSHKSALHAIEANQMEYGEIQIKRLPCLTFLGQRPKQAPLCHPARSHCPSCLLSSTVPPTPSLTGAQPIFLLLLLLLNMIMWHAAKASVNYLLHNFCSPTTTMKTNKFLHSAWVYYYFWLATQKIVTKTPPFASIKINNNSYLP